MNININLNNMAKQSCCIDCGKKNSIYHKRCAECNYKSPERNKKISENQTGSGNPNWKGGRFKDANGYIRIKMKGHRLSDHNGYIREHRLIAEKKYSRKLKKGEIVHHLNGIRDDNRPENLVITTLKSHGEKTIKKLLQNRILELETKLFKL